MEICILIKGIRASSTPQRLEFQGQQNNCILCHCTRGGGKVWLFNDWKFASRSHFFFNGGESVVFHMESAQAPSGKSNVNHGRDLVSIDHKQMTSQEMQFSSYQTHQSN